MNNFDYKNLTPFKWFVLENFPFIENAFEAIDNYRLFSKVVEYLNKTIDNMNLTGEQMENVTNAMTALQNYINNYFDNLDVQDEINNKLDEMATDGTLENIINQQIFNELNSKIGNIQQLKTDNKTSLVNAINENNSLINKQIYGLWGIAQNQAHTKNYLIHSLDGKRWNIVQDSNTNNILSDSSAVAEINGFFYMIGNNQYSVSKDLKTWSNFSPIIENPPFRVWGSSFFYDETNDLIYCFSSYQFKSENVQNAIGSNSYYFKLVYNTGVQNEDGTITWDSNINDLLYNENESYIDPYVIHDSKKGYLIAFKDELNSIVKVHKMSNLSTITDNICTIKGVGVEAPQLITDDFGNIDLYVQNYYLYPPFISGLEVLPNTTGRIKISDETQYINDATAFQEIINFPVALKHMGIAYCSENCYRLIKTLGVKPVSNVERNNFRTVGTPALRTIDQSGEYTIVNDPNIIYLLGTLNTSEGTSVNLTLNLKPVFKNTPFKVCLCNSLITWKGDVRTNLLNRQLDNQYKTVGQYCEIPIVQGGAALPPINI